MQLPKKFSIKSRSKSTKPKTRWSVYVHTGLNLLLPIVLLALIWANLEYLAIIVALFSKWRVVAVRPQHFMANLRSNAVDIVVKLSTLSFMITSQQIDGDISLAQLAWTGWYMLWLTYVKPKSDTVWVGLQALTAQLLGLAAVFQFADTMNQVIFIALIWVISLSSARHFFASYEEPWAKAMSHIWALFITQLSWILFRWILVYVFVPQIVLIVAVMAYTLGSIYHAFKEENLKPGFVRQQLVMATIIIGVIIITSNWTGEI